MPVNDCVQLHNALAEALSVVNDFRQQILRLQEGHSMLLQQNHILRTEFSSLEEEAFAERSQLQAENHILRQQNQRLQHLMEFDATVTSQYPIPAVAAPRRKVHITPNSKGHSHTHDKF
jgi:hypothetical protein